MKLSRVELLESNFDPKTGKDGGYGGRHSFLAEEGYELELDYQGRVSIYHPNYGAELVAFERCRYVLPATGEFERSKPPAALPENPNPSALKDLYEVAPDPMPISAKDTTDADLVERVQEREQWGEHHVAAELMDGVFKREYLPDGGETFIDSVKSILDEELPETLDHAPEPEPEPAPVQPTFNKKKGKKR